MTEPKEDVTYTQREFSITKRMDPVICDNMKGTKDHNKGNRLETERACGMIPLRKFKN